MSQSAPHLKRSQKTDFASPFITRERSFIRPSNNAQKRRSQTIALTKAKPTMEIYRPPNVRTDLQFPKLNVHAKEFTMNELHASKSSGNILSHYEAHPSLQHSKSSGSILRMSHLNHQPLVPLLPTPLPLPLLHSTSSSQILGALPRFGYHHPQFGQQIFQGHNQPQPQFCNYQPISNQALKRSKSLGASDASHNLAAKLKVLAQETIELSIFPEEQQGNLKIAMEDPNQLPSRVLMDLVKTILGRVLEGIRYSEAGAKLCISIIEKEKNQTFMESLLNMCQQWYQERDKILRGVKAGDGTRFTAFMWFLTEMCGQLKRRHVKEYETLQPELALLSVLAKCCQACVSLPIKCLSETECLFFVLTSIGKDLETELPQQLEQLLASVRDGFLASAGAPAVRRTLLQLIELHASNWQLPGSSVLYYYPRIK